MKYLEKETKCYLSGATKKEIEIGRINTRKCKLFKSLFNPLGIAKTIDTVFGDIQLPKDGRNQEIWNEYLGKRGKESIIRNTWKEIQRILSKHNSKKNLILHLKNRKVWLDINQ